MKHYMHRKIRLSHVGTLTYRPPSYFSIRKCKLVTQLFMCFIVWISGLQMRLNIGVIYLCDFLTPVNLTERRERRRDWILDDYLGFVSWLDLDGPSLSFWMNTAVNYDYVKNCSEDRRGLSVIKVGDDWRIYWLSPPDWKNLSRSVQTSIMTYEARLKIKIWHLAFPEKLFEADEFGFCSWLRWTIQNRRRQYHSNRHTL